MNSTACTTQQINDSHILLCYRDLLKSTHPATYRALFLIVDVAYHVFLVLARGERGFFEIIVGPLVFFAVALYNLEGFGSVVIVVKK